MKKILLWVIVLGILGISACSGGSGANPTPPPAGVTLEGPLWHLQSFGYTRMAVPARATLRLTKGAYQGFSGCNHMQGKVRIRGNSIRFEPGVSTMLACDQISLESRYRRLLYRSRSFRIEGKRLLLFGEGGGAPLLIFSTK
ncbi:META domain-containing protein [Nitratifractor sp.]